MLILHINIEKYLATEFTEETEIPESLSSLWFKLLFGRITLFIGGAMVIDARGQGCPKPVLMAEEVLSKISEGLVEILVDNEASVKNLTRFANKGGFYTEATKDGKHWRVKIAKGYACELESPESGVRIQELNQETQPSAVSAQPLDDSEAGKDLMLIIGTDTMGKEEELGKTLMKGFFETIKVTKEIPHTMFFLNAGVKLTTVCEDIIPVLKGIEALGVEIFSCGTCLKYYNLEASLKVGYRGTTNHIVEGMKDFRKTVWIG